MNDVSPSSNRGFHISVMKKDLIRSVHSVYLLAQSSIYKAIELFASSDFTGTVQCHRQNVVMLRRQIPVNHGVTHGLVYAVDVPIPCGILVPQTSTP